VTFSGALPQATDITVPRFQELKTLRGDWTSIARQIEELKFPGSRAWLEIVYEGGEIAGDLRARLDEAVAGSGIEILRIKNNRVLERALVGTGAEETLDDLDVTEVFKRCLQAHDVPEDQHPALLGAYREVIVSLRDSDPPAGQEKVV
jgi:exonuclease SbcD